MGVARFVASAQFDSLLLRVLTSTAANSEKTVSYTARLVASLVSKPVHFQLPSLRTVYA